jgi:hypothetical protein
MCFTTLPDEFRIICNICFLVCNVSNWTRFRCIIHIIHAYLFLFFYYGCQMAGLLKCIVYMYYTCVNYKLKHIALCYDCHTSLCVSYNTTCTAILMDGMTRTTRPDGRCHMLCRVSMGKYTEWLLLHSPNNKWLLTYSKIFIFYITPIRVCRPIQDRSDARDTALRNRLRESFRTRLS